jgi:hypothetical protein
MKTTSQRTQISGRRRSYWRLFWAVVFLLHAPITFKVFATLFGPENDRTAWSSIFLLALTNAFFIAEIAFAYSVRLVADRRSMLVFMLVVAFMHAGVIDRNVPDAVRDWSLVAGFLPMAMGALALALLLNTVLFGSAAGIADSAQRRRQLALQSYGALFKPIFSLRPQASACRYAARRGPPSTHS